MHDILEDGGGSGSVSQTEINAQHNFRPLFSAFDWDI